MTRERLTEEIIELIQGLLDDDEIQVSGSSTASILEEWDSMLQIELIASLEEQYSIKISLNEASRLSSIQAIVDYIQANL